MWDLPKDLWIAIYKFIHYDRILRVNRELRNQLVQIPEFSPHDSGTSTIDGLYIMDREPIISDTNNRKWKSIYGRTDSSDVIRHYKMVKGELKSYRLGYPIYLPRNY